MAPLRADSLTNLEPSPLPRTDVLREQAGAPAMSERAHAAQTFAPPDDLSREVYCVLGIPVDAVDMFEILRKIDAASAGPAPFLLSTPNLNFLVTSRTDPEFRESLLLSDVCAADGMPIVWICRLTGVPIKGRVAGADIFDMLKGRRGNKHPMTVCLFGGAEGVAAAASRVLNSEASGLTCVESIYPGSGSVEDMSKDKFIDTINSSGADFLAVSLGARKGQAWLQYNHDRLRIPIRAHLGATINFQTGDVKRAPATIRNAGFEWLWRIKEEPRLWRRYWHDGCVLLRLLTTCVLPLATVERWRQFKCELKNQDLLIKRTQDHGSVVLSLSGVATASNIGKAATYFRSALTAGKAILILDLTDTQIIDARFLGLLLMLRKQLKRQGAGLSITGVTPLIARIFRLNNAEFLLASHREA
jgi:N-acetylglucosaminyldiphosphoundecaprenol N-acetyl-beta-D-mannosaminyltransferase